MGTGEQNVPDAVQMVLRPGNIAVIASDGVVSGKTDEEIRKILRECEDGDMKSLAKAVLMAGCDGEEANDDRTVLTVRLEQRT